MRCLIRSTIAAVLALVADACSAGIITVTIPSGSGVVEFLWESGESGVMVSVSEEALLPAEEGGWFNLNLSSEAEGRRLRSLSIDTASAYARSSLANLAASTSAHTPARSGQHADTAAATSYAYNQQLLLMDFANAVLLPVDVPFISATVYLDGWSQSSFGMIGAKEPFVPGVVNRAWAAGAGPALTNLFSRTELRAESFRSSRSCGVS